MMGNHMGNGDSGGTMRRVKSIDQLYTEVKGYGLVITNDAALATALNKINGKPRVGPFAMTPQQIASACAIETLRRPIMGELKIAMKVHDEADIDFRTVHSTIQYVQEVRRYTRDVISHLHTDDARRIYEIYRKMPTLEKAMEDFNPEKCSLYGRAGRIAVIGLYIDSYCDKRYGDLDLFNDLEKHVLPVDYDEIQLYDGTQSDIGNFVPYCIDSIYQIGNDRQIAENAVALIDRNHSTDYAIVMKPDSHLADAVRASLYRHGMPFVNSLSVKDLNQVRDYIEYINLALSFETLRIGDIRELFSTLGYALPESMDEHLVLKERFDDIGGEYSSTEMEECRQFMEKIRSRTFDEVREYIFREDSTSVKTLIDDLDVRDEKIKATLLSRIKYAVEKVNDLQHNESIPESERRGVLLADCSNSVFIDRPIVIYLGMEQDWNIDLSKKKYVSDKDDEVKRAAVRLEILLQQGQRRFYMVNTSKDGEEPHPCLSFDEIFSNPVKRFSDICSKIVRASWVDLTDGQTENTIPVSPDAPPYEGNLSQSALSEFYKCPRAFMFHSLVPSEENEKMEFGNIIHEFAEFYVTHKGIVDEKGLSYFIEKACERYSGITSPMTEGLDRCRIGRAMQSVKAFIDGLAIGEVSLDKPVKQGSNYFFDCIDPKVEHSSQICETDRCCDELHLHGKMDLCANGMIIDYKTGKAKSGKEIVKNMDYRKPSSNPDFQPLVYLAIGRELGITGREFDLFYAMDNDSESGTDGYDINKNMRRVFVVDVDDKGFLNDSRVAEAISMNLKTGSYLQKYTPLFISSLLDVVKDEVSIWHEQLPDIIKNVQSNFQKAYSKSLEESTIRNAVNIVLKTVEDGIAGSEKQVIIRIDAIKTFIKEIEEVYCEIKEMSKGRFSATPMIQCEKCNYYSLCTSDKVTVDEESESSE